MHLTNGRDTTASSLQHRRLCALWSSSARFVRPIFLSARTWPWRVDGRMKKQK